jgi:hypothetical protein
LVVRSWMLFMKIHGTKMHTLDSLCYFQQQLSL